MGPGSCFQPELDETRVLAEMRSPRPLWDTLGSREGVRVIRSRCWHFLGPARLRLRPPCASHGLRLHCHLQLGASAQIMPRYQDDQYCRQPWCLGHFGRLNAASTPNPKQRCKHEGDEQATTTHDCRGPMIAPPYHHDHGPGLLRAVGQGRRYPDSPVSGPHVACYVIPYRRK